MIDRRLSAAAWLLTAGLAVAQQSPVPEGPSTGDAAPAVVKRPKTAQSEAGEPRASAAPAAAPAAPVAPAARPTAGREPSKADRLELDTTTVTGNRELPKVMYVVPWKKSDIGDLVGKPMNSLLDEVLAPVDRDVFRREVSYYQALHGQAEPKTPVSPAQGEK